MQILTFHVLNSHMWLLATIWDNTDTKHFHHHRKFLLDMAALETNQCHLAYDLCLHTSFGLSFLIYKMIIKRIGMRIKWYNLVNSTYHIVTANKCLLLSFNDFKSNRISLVIGEILFHSLLDLMGTAASPAPGHCPRGMKPIWLSRRNHKSRFFPWNLRFVNLAAIANIFYF